MKTRFKHASRWVFAVSILLLTPWSDPARAQGSFNGITVLRAAGAEPLITETRELQVDPSFALPVLQFTFGFATDETVVPGQFADSFTVTLQDASLATTIILLTADASGTVWAPLTPGTVPISPEAILRRSAPFPASIEPVLQWQFAYQVEAPLPAAFTGQSFSLHFDLFDNMNGVRSIGWFSDITVVPEPRLWFAAALALFYLLRRRQ
jgi:hypothetical protein